MNPWQSNPVTVACKSIVSVDVKANEKSVVLAQGDDVWFHDLHLEPADANAIADALIEGARQCMRMRARS